MGDGRSHVRRTAAAYERSAAAYARGKGEQPWLAAAIARFGALAPPPGRVLDLGCGPGVEAGKLQAAGWRVVGLDIAAASLGIARRDHPVSGYLRGEFLHLPFADGSFDGVWAAASLLHLTRAEAPVALAEVRRVLRGGGAFYCSMQLGSSAGVVVARAGESVRGARYYAFYEPAAWRARLEDAGFAVQALETAEFAPELAAVACNGDARGWISAYARTPR